jgi:iron complex outermembrane receptor protein
MIWKSRFAGLLGASAIALCAPAYAQSGIAERQAEATSTDNAAAIADIVVTAQFRGQSLQNTPLAITAVTGEMLTRRGQTNVFEIANQVPNVTLKPSVAAWGPSLVASIRGVGQYNFNPALEPGVGVFVDDVYYATLTGSLLELLDVERIEVLRGPQGTLSGRNSIGGAIRVITQKPKGDGSGYLEATGGSRKLVALRGSIDMPITENLAARISGALRSQDGFVERLDFGCDKPGQGLPATRPAPNCKLGDNLGGLGNQALRGQLSYTPNGGVELLLAGDYVRENHSNAGQVLTFSSFDNPITNPAPGVPLDGRFICGRFCNYATYQHPAGTNGYTAFASSADPQTRYEGWGLSGVANIDLTDTLKLTSITSFRRYATSFASDDDLSPASLGIEATNLQHRFFSQEVRLNAELGRLEYTLGGFYSSQKTVFQGFFDIRPYGIQYTTDDRIPAETAAAFATAIYPVTDALTVTAGVRYTYEKKDYTFFHFKLDGSVDDPALQGRSNTARSKVVDYRLSLDYRWSPEVLTYFTASSGFKGGGINPFPSTAALILPFGPEKLKNYEIGLKTDLFDRRVRFNAAVFLNDYSGIQLTRLSCPEFGVSFCSLVVNGGDAKNKGGEVELTMEPIDGLLIDASASYLDFDFTRINPRTGLSRAFVPPFTPKVKWSVGGQYAIDLGGSGTLTPRFDVSYQSEIFTNAANAPTNRIAPYTLANARLTWENTDRDLSVTLNINNLLNKYYFLNNFDLVATTGVIDAQPGAPREFSLIVRKRF